MSIATAVLCLLAEKRASDTGLQNKTSMTLPRPLHHQSIRHVLSNQDGNGLSRQINADINFWQSAESLKVVKEREICTPKSPVKLHLIHKIYILNVQIAVLKVVTNLTIIILHIII